MTKLTEHTVLARTRAQDLRSVRKLNAWGSELTDVSIVKKLPNVEVLSLSVNNISSLQDFAHCKNLQELYLRKNKITELSDIQFLKDLPSLHSLWLADNPCAEGQHYRLTVIRNLPQLVKLDNQPVAAGEDEEAKLHGYSLEDLQHSHVSSSPTSENVQSDVPCSAEGSPDYNNESIPFKTSTPAMSPVDPLPLKLDETTLSNRSYIEDSSNSISQYHDCEQNTDVSSHQFYSESQYNSSIVKRVNVVESKTIYEQDLPLDRPDLVANEKFHSNAATGHSGKSSNKSERTSALKLLPKGGRNRNANILSAVLCLIKELDLPSLEVVDTAVHCQMEELDADDYTEA